MKINPFKLERYFAKYEFTAPYLLCCSDCEALAMQELLAMADADSRRLWEKLTLSYTESQGHPVLREEIASLYRTISPDNVMTAVPEEAIYIAINTLLKQGDHVIVTFPGYQSLYEIANSLGCEISKWTPSEDKGWTFDVDDLRKLIRDNTKLIVINFPHNPTGAVLAQRELLKIIEIAEENNIVLFSDEMYRLLEYEEAVRPASACDLYANAVSLFGMSKSFALPGLRIGWLATKNTVLLRRFSEYKDYTTICSSAPAEILTIMALRAGDKILKRNLRLIEDNLKQVDTFFDHYAEYFQWVRPKAGPIGFPRLMGELRAAGFCDDLVQSKGVLLLPAGLYDYDDRHFRIGFARRYLPEAMEKLREYMDEHFG